MNKKQLMLIMFFPLISLINLQAATVFPIGDVNKSSGRDIVDALLIAQYATGIRSMSTFFLNVADVNLDNKIDIVDAMQVAQASTGLLTALAAEASYMRFQNQLDSARKQWQFQRLYSYTMNLQRYCFCPDVNTIYKLDVDQDTKVAVLNTSNNSQVDPSLWGGFPTISELFVKAQEAIDRKYIINSLTIDPTYSFISRISVDPDKQIVDEEWALAVTNFQPKDPIPPIVWTPKTPEELGLSSGALIVTKAVINSNMLSIGVEYGGGCYEHRFTVYASEAILKSLPPPRSIYMYRIIHREMFAWP